MVWTLPPQKSVESEDKIFYNGKPIVVAADYKEEKDTKLPDPLSLPINTILHNVSVTLNNIIHDIITGKEYPFTKSNRLFYLGIFLVIIGIVITVVVFFFNSIDVTRLS